MTSRAFLPSQNMYVDTVNGSDSNDGFSTTTAKKTIGSMLGDIYGIYDCQGGTPTINVMPGSTVTEQIKLFGQVPGATPEVFITGSTTGGQYIPWVLQGNNQAAVQVRDNGICTISGFSFSAQSYTGCRFLNPSQQGVCDYQNINFGPCSGGQHIYIDHGGSANCLDTNNNTVITGSAQNHIYMQGNAAHYMAGATINISSGLSFGYFIQGCGPCFYNWGYNVFSGSSISGTKFALTYNAVLLSGSTIIPGSGYYLTTGAQCV